MKYYLKQIITTTDGIVADEKKYTYDDETSALVRFHSMMAGNMNEPTISMCTLMIVKDDGIHDLYVMRNETYRKPVVPVVDEKKVAIDKAVADYVANQTDENLEKFINAVATKTE